MTDSKSNFPGHTGQAFAYQPSSGGSHSNIVRVPVRRILLNSSISSGFTAQLDSKPFEPTLNSESKIARIALVGEPSIDLSAMESAKKKLLDEEKIGREQKLPERTNSDPPSLSEDQLKLAKEIARIVCAARLSPIEIFSKSAKASTRAKHISSTLLSFEEVVNRDCGGPVNWPSPKALQELHVVGKDRSYRFTGENAFKRLAILNPHLLGPLKVPEGTRNALVKTTVGDHLIFQATLATFFRSYAGSCKEKDFRTFIRNFEGKCVLPSDFKGALQNKRFFQCVPQIHAFFTHVATIFDAQKVALCNLRDLLVSEMLHFGDLNPPGVNFFKQSLEELLEKPRTKLGSWLFSLPLELRATLYRSRRLFLKDVRDLEDFSRKTLETFCSPPVKIGAYGWEKLQFFITYELKPWMKTNRVRLLQRLKELPLHCSKASIFFPRSAGGGVTERNLVLGLYRLSKNIPTPLFKPAGELKNDASLREIVTLISPVHEIRDEILLACDWWLKEVSRVLPVTRQVISILPERENKPRSFFLWDWVTQFCSMFYKEPFRLFFKEQPFCAEAFSGMRTNEVTSMLNKHPGDTLASLDSQAATDNIPYPVCKALLETVDDMVPDFARRGTHAIFEPFRAQVAKSRPHLHMGDLAKIEDFGRNLPFKITYDEFDPVAYPQRRFEGKTTGFLPDLPASRGFQKILAALRENGRVLLKSPTGTGKTVLAAGAFRSIITFPSIAALSLFQASCKFFNIPFNLYYSRQKGQLVERETGVDADGNPTIETFESIQCDEDGVPYTILTTEAFLVPLARRFGKMLVVIDEADTFRAQTVFNCMETQRLGLPTLLMTATPELMNEPRAVVVDLEGPTRFPVTENECTLKELPQIVRGLTGKCLICTFSEPHCDRIARMFPDLKVLILNSETRRGNTAEQVAEAELIISTSVIRSSVTIPGLVHVFDVGLVYRKIDLSRNGFDQLLLFQANSAEKKQLKGRVGRLQPGTYWTVKSVGRFGIKPPTEVLERATCFSSAPQNLLLGLQNRGLNTLSVLLEHASREMIGRICGKDPHPMRPQILDLIEHFDPPEGAQLAIAVLLEESMVVNLCRNSNDLEIKAIGDLRELSEADPVRVNLHLWRAIEKTNLFEQERFLIRRWTENLKAGSIQNELSDSALLVLGVYFWRRIARTLNGNFCGVYRDFLANTPRTKFGGEYFLCWDLGYDNGTLQSRRAYLLDRIWPTLQEEFRGHRITVPRIPLTYPILTNDFVGGKGSVGKISMKVPDRARVYEPRELPLILQTLKETLEDCGSGPIMDTQTGCPMSSVISFSMLNAVSLATANCSSAASKGFGDDLLGKGEQSDLLAIEKARSDLGLLTKRESTGYGKVGDDAFCVFTERFWSNKTLQPINSLKPQGLVFLSRALDPQSVIGPGKFFLPDYESARSQMLRHFPNVSRLREYRPNVKIAYQQTPLRRMLIASFAKDASESSLLCEESDAEVLIGALEAVLLPLMPSQRAAPLRVDEVKHTPLLVSFESISNVVDTLEGFGFWTPLHLQRFRTTDRSLHSALLERYDLPYSGELKSRFLQEFEDDNDF